MIFLTCIWWAITGYAFTHGLVQGIAAGMIALLCTGLHNDNIDKAVRSAYIKGRNDSLEGR